MHELMDIDKKTEVLLLQFIQTQKRVTSVTENPQDSKLSSDSTIDRKTEKKVSFVNDGQTEWLTTPGVLLWFINRQRMNEIMDIDIGGQEKQTFGWQQEKQGHTVHWNEAIDK